GYACSAACDCKLGEVCGANGFCAAEAAPTVLATDLAGALAAAKPGDRIALRAGDRFTVAGPTELPGSVAIAGGDQACSATRWVRDPAARTTITSGTATGTIFTINGALATPKRDVILRGLALTAGRPDGNWTMVQAAYAPGLTVEDSSITFMAPIN